MANSVYIQSLMFNIIRNFWRDHSSPLLGLLPSLSNRTARNFRQLSVDSNLFNATRRNTVFLQERRNELKKSSLLLVMIPILLRWIRRTRRENHLGLVFEEERPQHRSHAIVWVVSRREEAYEGVPAHNPRRALQLRRTARLIRKCCAVDKRNCRSKGRRR